MNDPHQHEPRIDRIYGEPPADNETADRELLQLQRVRQLLDRAAAGGRQSRPVLDPLQLVQRALERIEAGRRRWRRAAWLGASAAAVLLAFQLAGLHVEVHPSHLVVAWNRSPARADSAPLVRRDRQGETDAALEAHQSRLDDLDKLVHLLVQANSADQRQREREFIALLQRLDALDHRHDTRWRTVAHLLRSQTLQYTALPTDPELPGE